MKSFLYFFLFLLLSFSVKMNLNAQQLFQPVPLDFGIWSGLMPGVMYYDSIAEVSYISGKFNTVNDTPCNVIKYDGANYFFLPKSPIRANYTRVDFNAIIRYKDKIYFGGDGLATWDGTNWAVVDSNIDVGNLIVHEDKLYVTGMFDSIAGQAIGMVAVWNDTTWSDLYKIDTFLKKDSSDAIGTIAFYKGKIYVAGNFYHSTHPDLEDLMMFDGQTWTNVGGFKVDGMAAVTNLLVWEDQLYVAGAFVESSGSPGNAIAKWDGTNWQRLGDGLMHNNYPGIYDMINYKESLYMCGIFKYMNGVDLGTKFRGFVKWDGNQWCSVGFHADNVVIGLGTWKDELFIMGGFKVVNGDSMQYMAKWVGGNYTDVCSTPTTSIENRNPNLKLTVSPNPTTGEFNIRFNNDRTHSTYAVRITNILGKIIYSTNHTANIGMNQFNIDLSGTASGIYFLNIKDEYINESIKLIKK